MEHGLFKPKGFEDGRHSVVGNCNGFSMEERWEAETPAFAKKILEHYKGGTILDYGCGVGRLAKEILKQNDQATVIGLDASPVELELAKEYVNDSRFIPVLPHELNQGVDLAYCVYVLQHAPAIEIREILARIHHYLRDQGRFIYCSSDYRMAIRFDGGGFYDDRHLGVDLREEVGRLFSERHNLFDAFPNPVIEKMVTGGADGLPHPAIVYDKKPVQSIFSIVNDGISDEIQATQPEHYKSQEKPVKTTSKKKLILRNRLAPGDCLVMTAAIRSLHEAHPGKFETDVQSPCGEIFQNNPYVTPLGGIGQVIDMQYPEIHKSGRSGRHFSDGHRKHLEDVLGIRIPRTGLLPEIYMSQDEKLWPSPVLSKCEYAGDYLVINAGSKQDFPLKQYHRWQDVVDLWNGAYPRIKLVQIGDLSHDHKPLDGALDIRGNTTIRELFRVVHHSKGVFTCVSFPMHIAAAMHKSCVVVAGGREGTRWELYPNHRFLYTNGALDCCPYDGCWRSKPEECVHWKGEYPLCLDLITPNDVFRAMEMYVKGGMISVEGVRHD